MKIKNEKIIKSCAFCVHAKFRFEQTDDNQSPCLAFLQANAMEDDVTLTCPYKKKAAPDRACHRFCFDPLKYRPQKMPSIPTLDTDALILD